MHMAGPAPSGDFWFLLVASKGTRRRQGIWGDVDPEFGFPNFLPPVHSLLSAEFRRFIFETEHKKKGFRIYEFPVIFYERGVAGAAPRIHPIHPELIRSLGKQCAKP